MAGHVARTIHLAGAGMKPVAVTVVFFGDSITEGQYVDPALRWTNLLVDQLTLAYRDTPVSLHFLNKGISGETSRQGLERFARDVQVYQPDVMTLQFGLNDCNCWVTDRGYPRNPLPVYRANMVEMIERARLFGAGEIIMQTNHETLKRKVMLSGETLEDARKRYNDAQRQIAAETGVTLCDIEQAFGPMTDAQLEDTLLPYPDHLHLSIAGHVRYAEVIKPYLTEAIARAVARGR
jgi:acyl-CoA thioesterase-1